MQKRSSPTVWLGNPIKTVGTRLYYDACRFENTVYKVWDAVLLNSDFDPLPIGRIVSMWEQAKKKRLTIEWFYRGHDIVRATQDRIYLEDDKADDEIGPDDRAKRRKLSDSISSAKNLTTVSPTNTSRRVATQTSGLDPDFKLTSASPRSEKKRTNGDSSTKKSKQLLDAISTAVDYINNKSENEIFVSSHKDDNYPSTLNCKVTVKHMDEIDDLDAYIAQGPKFLFFRKHIDLLTLELTDASAVLPSPEEAIDYDPKAARKRNQPLFTPFGVRSKKIRRPSDQPEKEKKSIVKEESDESTFPYETTSKHSIVLSKNFVESRTQARQNLMDESSQRQTGNHDVWSCLQQDLFEFRRITEDRLFSLEQVMKDQQMQLSEQLQRIEGQQKQNNELYAQMHKQVNTSLS